MAIFVSFFYTNPSGGELFERICNAGRFSNAEQVCHRDLKLENTLLDGSPAPRLKICDFGYSKEEAEDVKEPHQAVYKDDKLRTTPVIEIDRSGQPNRTTNSSSRENSVW
ncbi:unnamed protein product [Cuscuta epithymum]|uniref:Protein kinase domain-containing protein n=1 Tax=Cuscuta epithymum TaxID=186058 RepID=A0AAV0CSP2_9ASTE|nr:unnamed protein product [Cuscuta epithymum]